jgi:drug/metabolite transporter (DMT)-like permease
VIIIPPQSQRGTKPVTQHDMTVGMLVASVIMLGISLFIFTVGPRTQSPPPPMLGFAMLGLALVFGVIAFFSWIKEQGEGDDASQGNTPKEE